MALAPLLWSTVAEDGSAWDVAMYPELIFHLRDRLGASQERLFLERISDGHGKLSLPARSTLSSNQFLFEWFETERPNSG